MDLNFWRSSSIVEGDFKGLSQSTTPLKREDLIRIVESNIPKVTILSIPKMGL